jgi:creatinine amidohydrolase
MQLRPVLLVLAMVLVGSSASAEVVRIGDLNARQIRALDRNRTVVFLQGGMLEEHGPYLPAFTDGILSERLTLEVARGVVAKKPEWTALLFPPVSVGASGYNEIGRQFVFPGTYTVRPSTLKAIYMDLATELGEQGFKWIMVVHVHGAPLHIAALDEAGDYFRDTYGGRMVNLWGLLPVIGGWGSAMSVMTDAQKKEDGVSLHAGADEHALMLYLQPNLVAPDYLQAPSVTGSSYAESVAAATQKDWPGYIGAPRVGSAELGRVIWTSFSAAALKTTIEILDGVDPAKYQRYLPFMERNPAYQEWLKSATDRDRALGERQQAWTARRTQDATGDAAAQFAALEAAWNTAHAAGDAAALDRLWADDIVMFLPGMRPMNKAEALAALKDGAATFTRVETSDVHPRVTGDLALVTGRLQRTRTVAGRATSEDWQFRKVYRRDPSGWRVISYHAWESPK